MIKLFATLFLLAGSSSIAHAATGGPSMPAIVMFLIFIAGTMGIGGQHARLNPLLTSTPQVVVFQASKTV